MTDVDLSYVAALIDNFARLATRLIPSGTELPEVTIQNSRLVALDWLATVTGVGVTPVSKDYSRHQCSEHCPDRHSHIESLTRRWQLSGAKATIVLYNVEPFLRVQGVDARRLVDVGQGSGYKTNVVNEMSRLGWKIPELREQLRARVELIGA